MKECLEAERERGRASGDAGDDEVAGVREELVGRRARDGHRAIGWAGRERTRHMAAQSIDSSTTGDSGGGITVS
nr:hypothetical protein CFP56_04594 [Quercus suber]